MGPKTVNFRLQKRGYVGSSASGVLRRAECDINGLFFLTLGLTLTLHLVTCFYTFGLHSSVAPGYI